MLALSISLDLRYERWITLSTCFSAGVMSTPAPSVAKVNICRNSSALLPGAAKKNSGACSRADARIPWSSERRLRRNGGENPAADAGECFINREISLYAKSLASNSVDFKRPDSSSAKCTKTCGSDADDLSRLRSAAIARETPASARNDSRNPEMCAAVNPSDSAAAPGLAFSIAESSGLP